MTDASTLSRVTLRPVVPEDRVFLVGVYAASRAEELDQVEWPAGAREAFVNMQFDAQSRHYRTANPEGSFDVVEVGGRPAGRLYVDRRPTDIRIIDIALLPAFRGNGIGTALLGGVMEEAAASRRSVSIHVEATNRAAELYERLGFRLLEDRGVYRLLEWRAS